MGFIILHGCFELVLRIYSTCGKDCIIVCCHYFFFFAVIIILKKPKDISEDIALSCRLLGQNINVCFYSWEFKNMVDANVEMYKKLVI